MLVTLALTPGELIPGGRVYAVKGQMVVVSDEAETVFTTVRMIGLGQ